MKKVKVKAKSGTVALKQLLELQYIRGKNEFKDTKTELENKINEQTTTIQELRDKLLKAESAIARAAFNRQEKTKVNMHRLEVLLEALIKEKNSIIANLY